MRIRDIHTGVRFQRATILLILGALYLTACSHVPTPAPRSVPVLEMTTPVHVKSGLEVFLETTDGLPGQRVGLMTNQSAVDHDLHHAASLLAERVDLELLLSPEHGLYGAEDAGAKVGEEVDPATGIHSVSTYRRKPDEIAVFLENIDVVLFDIQDIGVRSYTYIYSMAYLMQAAAKSGTRVIILDRPNPIGGVQVEGNILEPEFASFVGLYPIPYRHGLTVGELAGLFNHEFGIDCRLDVIPMEGWYRELYFEDTDLPWVPTSPHVPHPMTILPMISTGVFGELHVLSEGVGTTIPFEFTGGPWIKDPREFAQAVEVRIGDGLDLRPTFVKPYYGRYAGQVCGGVQLYVTDLTRFKPYLAGLEILASHQELYPEVDLFANPKRLKSFQRVTGNSWILEGLRAGKSGTDLETRWTPALNEFLKKREKYLLYD